MLWGLHATDELIHLLNIMVINVIEVDVIVIEDATTASFKTFLKRKDTWMKQTSDTSDKEHNEEQAVPSIT
jgi:uncharacterized protein YxeA